MNSEPSFFIIGLHVATHDVIWNVLHVYLPLYSIPGMTISYICHDAKEGGRGPRLNVIMMLIFSNSLEVSP